MITALQERLQKHAKWLLLILLAVISLSFIFAYSYSGGAGQRQDKFNFYGFNLYEAKTQKRIFEGAGLSLYLHTGQTLRTEKELQELGFIRASLLSLADSLGIPDPEEEALKVFISNLPLFQRQDGSFNAPLYKEFQQEIESKLGASLAYQILSDDYRLQGIESLLTGPSYVGATEVESYLHQFHSLWTVSIARLKPEKPDTYAQELDPKALEAFYTSRPQSYRSPPKLCISYVCMDALEPVQAEEKAHALTYALYEGAIAYNTEAFHKTLEDRCLTLLELEPFPIGKVPENSPFPKDILEEVLNLDESTYYTPPLRVGERVYVLFLDSVLPAEQLAFEAVKAQVAQDYQAEHCRATFEAKAKSIAHQLGSIDSPEAFKAEANALGLEYQELSNFKLSHPPAELGLRVASHISKLKTGHVSSTFFQDEGAVWVYAVQKTPPVLTEADADWQLALQQIEALVQFSRLQSSLTDLVDRGLPKNP